MQLALRPYMTTGVALVGASVIAVSPIAPPPAALEDAATRVSSAAVELTAAFDPVTAYTQLVTNTVNNLLGLAGEVAADPAPILRQVLINSIGNAQILADSLAGVATGVQNTVEGLPAALEAAAGQLAEGDFAGAVDTVFAYVVGSVLFQIGLPLITGPVTVAQNIVGNFNNVVQNGILAVLLVALAPIYPINATVSAFGALGQDILDSAGSGDFVGVVADLISAPAVLADAFLNGFPEGTSSLISPAGGLLTGADVGFGTVENILAAKKAIAALLTRPAPPPEEVASDATPSKRLFTLNVAPNTAALTEGSTTGTDAASNTDAAKAKSGLADRLTKRANGATDLSDGNSATAATPRQRATAAVSGVQDKLTVKRGDSPSGLRTALGNLGKTRPDNSGADNSGADKSGDSGDSGGTK